MGLRPAVPLRLLTYFIVSLFLSLFILFFVYSSTATAVAADFKRAWVAGYSEVAPNYLYVVDYILEASASEEAFDLNL